MGVVPLDQLTPRPCLPSVLGSRRVVLLWAQKVIATLRMGCMCVGNWWVPGIWGERERSEINYWLSARSGQPSLWPGRRGESAAASHQGHQPARRIEPAKGRWEGLSSVLSHSSPFWQRNESWFVLGATRTPVEWRKQAVLKDDVWPVWICWSLSESLFTLVFKVNEALGYPSLSS